jgi:fatty-acyl-CoA synthase
MSKSNERELVAQTTPIRSRGTSDSDLRRATIVPVDGRSFVSDDRSEPLRHITIHEQLVQTVARFGAREAAVFPGQNIRKTYSELTEEVDRLARGFLAVGLETGDRVGIWSPNRYEWILTQFATARAGLVLVSINPAYRLSELEYTINKVGCRALVAAAAFKSSDYLGMIFSIAPELANCEPGRLEARRLPTLKMVIRMGDDRSSGMLNFNEVAEMGRHVPRRCLDEQAKSLRPDDPINIQFTSGTTGSPKGAALTHSNIVNNAHFVTRALNFTENDRLSIPVPLYHCFGMVMGVLGCATKGACMVFPGEGFEPDATLRAIEEERCTGLCGVPTMFVGLLGSPKFHSVDFSSLRTGIMAGAPCPIEVMKRVISEMNMREVTIALV